MPELPEVETVRQDLKKRILGKEILNIIVLDEKVTDINIKNIIGYFFVSINRIGKLLYFKLDNNDYLLVHLKMTGQLLFISDIDNIFIAGGHEDKAIDTDKLPNKHTRVIIKIKDAGNLFFNDLRRFAYLKVVKQKELEAIKSRFGVEPLKKEFNIYNLEKIFKNRKANIKSLLLNQELIAGIGNIYADEILFKAGILPMKMGAQINEKEVKKIYRATNYIIGKAIINRGTTFSDYLDVSGKKGNYSKLLYVYRRENKKCYKCKRIIKKIKLAGRGTHYCEVCQK